METSHSLHHISRTELHFRATKSNNGGRGAFHFSSSKLAVLLVATCSKHVIYVCSRVPHCATRDMP